MEVFLVLGVNLRPVSILYSLNMSKSRLTRSYRPDMMGYRRAASRIELPSKNKRDVVGAREEKGKEEL
jgi:hypothetical protein